VLFGYPPGALIGQRIEQLVPDALRQRHMQHRAHYYGPSPYPSDGGWS
jgi:hypothetical protein